MKIKADETLKYLSGEELKDEDNTVVTVGKILSNILLADKSGGKMKLYHLAQKFYSEKEVELDKSDLELVKKAVENSQGLSNLLTGQILEKLIDNAK